MHIGWFCRSAVSQLQCANLVSYTHLLGSTQEALVSCRGRICDQTGCFSTGCHRTCGHTWSFSRLIAASGPAGSCMTVVTVQSAPSALLQIPSSREHASKPCMDSTPDPPEFLTGAQGHLAYQLCQLFSLLSYH